MRPKKGHNTFVSDYQMNLSLFSKYSIQCQHWVKPQVTIFPIVSYFTIQKRGLPAQRIVASRIYLSNDPLHDVHFVKHCLKQFVEELEGIYGEWLPKKWCW